MPYKYYFFDDDVQWDVYSSYLQRGGLSNVESEAICLCGNFYKGSQWNENRSWRVAKHRTCQTYGNCPMHVACPAYRMYIILVRDLQPAPSAKKDDDYDCKENGPPSRKRRINQDSKACPDSESRALTKKQKKAENYQGPANLRLVWIVRGQIEMHKIT
jgi:hypothetical protein